MIKDRSSPLPVVGCILAGGSASRFQGHCKPLLMINGERVIDIQLKSLQTQVNAFIINGKPGASALAELGYPLITDATCVPAQGPLGPLAGVVAGLTWLTSNHRADWLFTVPGDTLLLPENLVAKLLAAAAESHCSYACCGDDHHYLVAVWHTSMLPELQAFLARGGRAVRAFMAEVGAVSRNFDTSGKPQLSLFFNINTPQDYKTACTHLEP